MKTASAQSPFSHAHDGTRGFPATSCFTTSAPELGVIDVFSEHAVKPQYELARHSRNSHSGIFVVAHLTVYPTDHLPVLRN